MARGPSPALTGRPAEAHDRRLAVTLALTLLALAAAAYALAAIFDFTLAPQQSLDPHRHGFAIAGGIAAAFCVVAMWRLRTLASGRTGRSGAVSWFAVAVVALFVLVVVAFASRLGG